MNLNSLDIENNMLSQHSQKPFWLDKFSANMFLFGVRKNICTAPFLDPQELHSWSTLKANVFIFLYISLRNLLFQRRSKVLSGKGCDGEGRGGSGWLNNFHKVAHCVGLAKCFKIFHFNWYFWKFYYFLAFWYFYL